MLFLIFIYFTNDFTDRLCTELEWEPRHDDGRDPAPPLCNEHKHATTGTTLASSVKMTATRLSRGFFKNLVWRGSGGLYPRDWHADVNRRLDCSRKALSQTLVLNLSEGKQLPKQM
jgi:hypothetical protein